MAGRLSFSRRLATAARWPLGVLVTGWDYLWRTTPMHRCETAGSVPDDLPPPLPPGTDDTDMQGVEAGYGPLMHRSYVARVREAKLAAADVIERFACRPNCASPTALATFVKVKGEEGEMHVGDEFTVRMPGPWDGPVRAVEVGPTHFSFVTLDGHLEAGRITFEARDLAPGCLEVSIEAWARGGDRVSNLLFDRLRVNKEVQLHMWTSVLERLIKLSGGRRDELFHITTVRVDEQELARAG
ncbi:MAG: hypothetical protein QOE11_1017 [Solirubrobacteraceae bacterium]|jgi:hypothetical protein|nr:hypothetical protein [Solirubrobacteraceae bacterium]